MNDRKENTHNAHKTYTKSRSHIRFYTETHKAQVIICFVRTNACVTDDKRISLEIRVSHLEENAMSSFEENRTHTSTVVTGVSSNMP